jgi:exosome complex component CSL4
MCRNFAAQILSICRSTGSLYAIVEKLANRLCKRDEFAIMEIPGYVVPGQIICPLVEKQDGITRNYQPGRGVISRSVGAVDALKATIAGKVKLLSLDGKDEVDVVMIDEEDSKNEEEFKFQVSIETNPGSGLRHGTSVLPEIGDIVYARVIKLTLTQAHVEILVVENQGAVSPDSGLGIHASGEGLVGLPSATQVTSGDVGEGFGGIIRIQDVRATERDKVKVQLCFKPGDIVRALVVSIMIGGSRSRTSSGPTDLIELIWRKNGPREFEDLFA